MAINKKLIHFKTKSNFSNEVANNNILDTSICFIKDSQQIYTHGQYYNCKDWANDINGLQTQINTILSGDASTAIDNFNEIVSFLEGVTDSQSLDSIIASIETQIANKQDKINDLETIRNNASKGATAVQPSQLASVATSGNYNDLTNKPTIPNAVTESTVSGWGFTKNTGTYTKPSTGIPKTDLASAVQTSLDKADTALQSYTETDPVFSASVAARIKESDITNWNSKTSNTGTITGVSANGTSVATSGVANIPAASTSKYGVTKLSSATNSTSTSLAATASAVKAAYDLAASKTSNTGTITGIKMNGASKGTSGVVDLGTVITEHQDISNLATKIEVNNAQTAAQTYADNAVAALVNGAPETLDTLDELALALKDNKDIVDVLNQSISNKQDKGNYVTTDTEQTITGKKYINDTTFRFKNSENTIETVVTNRAISMQPMDGVEKPSSILNIQSMTGGKIHITNSNSKNQTVWPKQLSVTNLKYDTQDRCGVYVDTDENRQLVVVGYFKNVNGVFYTLSSLSTGKYVEIVADCLYLHSGASSNAELNAAAFKWDGANSMLHFNRKYYDGLIKDGNLYAVVNTTGGNGGFAAMHHTNNSRGIFALQNTGLVISHLKNVTSSETTGKDINVYNYLAGKISLSTYDGYNMQGWGGQIAIQTSKMIGANTPGSSVSLIMKGSEQNNVDESFTILGAANYVNKNLTHIAEKVDGHRIGLGATKLLMHGPVETEADQNAACFEWNKENSALTFTRQYYDTTSSTVKSGNAEFAVNSAGDGGYTSINTTTGVKSKIGTFGNGVMLTLQRADNNVAPTKKSIQFVNYEGGDVSIHTMNNYTGSYLGGQINLLSYNGSMQDRSGLMVGRGDADSYTILGRFNNSVTSSWALAGKVVGNAIQLGAKHLLIQDKHDTIETTNAADITWDNTTNTLDIKRAYYNSGSLGTGDAKLTLNGKQVATITNVVNHGTSDKSFALTPNTYHVWGTMSSLTLTLSTPADTTVYNEYMFEFTSGSTATTLSLPSTIKWVDAPDIKTGTTYQVSIVNGLGVIAGFSA